MRNFVLSDVVWYSTEAKTRELLLVSVRFENFANFLNTQLIIVELAFFHLVVVSIGSCEVDSYGQINEPARFEILDKTWLLHYFEAVKNYCAC